MCGDAAHCEGGRPCRRALRSAPGRPVRRGGRAAAAVGRAPGVRGGGLWWGRERARPHARLGRRRAGRPGAAAHARRQPRVRLGAAVSACCNGTGKARLLLRPQQQFGPAGLLRAKSSCLCTPSLSTGAGRPVSVAGVAERARLRPRSGGSMPRRAACAADPPARRAGRARRRRPRGQRRSAARAAGARACSWTWTAARMRPRSCPTRPSARCCRTARRCCARRARARPRWPPRRPPPGPSMRCARGGRARGRARLIAVSAARRIVGI